MGRCVTVAVPVRNGGAVLDETLSAVRGQRLDPDISVEILLCDSGSRDGSAALARSHGATVIEIRPEQFSHGGTRNMLMERAGGEHVAFLTQDAVPADDRWLERLLGGFGLADDVALVFGPYRARPGASPMVARELSAWFASFSPDGAPRVDRLEPDERALSAGELLGPRGYFTDANGCVARAAWREAPFRSVPYAEDHLLAHDLLRAGFAKVYLPDAAVLHSHEYSDWEWLRRSFDEGRALADLYGYVEPVNPRQAALKIRGLVGADWRWARGNARDRSPCLLIQSTAHHAARITGAVLGSRAQRLPRTLVRLLSLEKRA